MNYAAINMGVHIVINFPFYSLWVYVPGSGIAAHMVGSFLILGGTFILFSIAAEPVYITTKDLMCSSINIDNGVVL